MRTYGLVCMASTALTVFVGHASFWYGGTAGHIPADPTRVVQGVVTGIGFLGAGVIMKDGLSISGLTTAASIWAASAIGVLLGVGFYAAALLLALLCMVSMSLLHRLEAFHGLSYEFELYVRRVVRALGMTPTASCGGRTTLMRWAASWLGCKRAMFPVLAGDREMCSLPSGSGGQLAAGPRFQGSSAS